MIAIIGLGNPGPKYQLTRHNIGARVVKAFAEEVLGNGRCISWEKKFSCLFQRGTYGDKPILVILPQSFMNLSGETVRPLLEFYKCDPTQLVVVYDELDLAPAVVRLKEGGASGGHHGLEDVMHSLGTGAFFRVRVGIGHPRQEAENKEQDWEMDVSDWVLSCPADQDLVTYQEGEKKAVLAVKLLLEEGLSAAQRTIHPRPKVQLNVGSD